MITSQHLIKTLTVDSELDRTTPARSATTTPKIAEPEKLVRTVVWKRANTICDVHPSESAPKVYQVVVRSSARGMGLVNAFRSFAAPGGSAATMVVTDSQIAPITSRISELILQPDEDCIQPTEYAYMNAVSKISAAYTLVKLQTPLRYWRLPIPIVTADDTGAVRVSWSHDGRRLRVNFGASPQNRSYLYYEIQQHHGVEELEPEVLARRLNWLI